ncbi:hypothetical protein BH11ACT3_BH11ACT3_07590 [soil metagenome]
MTFTPRPFLPALALLICTLPVLAGCSPAEAGSPATTAPPSTQASTDPSSGAAGPAATGEELCALVSVDEANAAMNPQPAFTEQAPGTFVDGEPECGFTTDDRSIIVNVTIFDTSTNDFDMQNGVVGDSLTPTSGIGDAAGVGTFEVDVVVGTQGLVVENFTDGNVTSDQLVALAKLFVSRIG